MQYADYVYIHTCPYVYVHGMALQNIELWFMYNLHTFIRTVSNGLHTHIRITFHKCLSSNNLRPYQYKNTVLSVQSYLYNANLHTWNGRFMMSHLHLYAERLQGYFMVYGTTPNTNTSEVVIPDALTSQWYQCRETILVAIFPGDTKNYLVKPDSNLTSDHSSSIFLRYNSYGLFVLFNTEYICTTMNQSWSPVVCNWGYTRGIMH